MQTLGISVVSTSALCFCQNCAKMNEDVLTTATNISSIILNSSLMHIPQMYYDHNRGQIDHDHYDENYDMMEEDDQQQEEQEQNLGDNYKENMTPAHENMILHIDIVPVEMVRRRIVQRQLQPTSRSPLLPLGVSRSYQVKHDHLIKLTA